MSFILNNFIIKWFFSTNHKDTLCLLFAILSGVLCSFLSFDALTLFVWFIFLTAFLFLSLPVFARILTMLITTFFNFKSFTAGEKRSQSTFFENRSSEGITLLDERTNFNMHFKSISLAEDWYNANYTPRLKKSQLSNYSSHIKEESKPLPNGMIGVRDRPKKFRFKK